MMRMAGRTPVTVFSDTGERLAPVPVAESRAVASRFRGLPARLIRDAGYRPMRRRQDYSVIEEPAAA